MRRRVRICRLSPPETIPAAAVAECSTAAPDGLPSPAAASRRAPLAAPMSRSPSGSCERPYGNPRVHQTTLRQVGHERGGHHHRIDHPVPLVKMAMPLQQQTRALIFAPRGSHDDIHVSRRRGSGGSASRRPPADPCALHRAAGRRELAAKVKRDGHRLLAVVAGGELQLLRRNGHDRTALFRAAFRGCRGARTGARLL
jgi:hypothetical protein